MKSPYITTSEPYLNQNSPTDSGEEANIFSYLEPRKYYADHPEFYALRDGKRVEAGLCKSNVLMRETYFNNITASLNQVGLTKNDIFVIHISEPDGADCPCQCRDCLALNQRYGGNPVGQMLDLLNWLAERGRDVWPPGVKLETLAYSLYETPPPQGDIDDNVIVRFAPIEKHHWDRLDSPLNRGDYANLRGWRRLARDVRIWDYPHQYSDDWGPVSGLTVSPPQDPGLREWVRQAVRDPLVARAGLQLSLAGSVSAMERHVFTGVAPARGISPTLLVRWQGHDKSEPALKALTATAAAIVSSGQPDTVAQCTTGPGIFRPGGLQLAGAIGQPADHPVWSYLRFAFEEIPVDAQIIDAELVLSRVFVQGNDGEGRIAFRAVAPGANWDPTTLTWNTQPAVGDSVLFSLRLAPPVPGYWNGTKYGEECEYTFTGLFPQPNLKTLVHNIRVYKGLGVQGIFLETDADGLGSGIHCLADLTFWVLMQALWNPDRSADELIHDFCEHYYGPAGRSIEKYVRRLDEAYLRDPHHVAFHIGQYALQSFVNYDFLHDAHGLFDQAEQACSGDAIRLDRVRRARLSLDLVTLFNMGRIQTEYKSRSSSMDRFPFDRNRIEQRYMEARLSSTRRRFPSRNLDVERAEIDTLLAAARKAGVWTLWRTQPPEEDKTWTPNSIPGAQKKGP